MTYNKLLSLIRKGAIVSGTTDSRRVEPSGVFVAVRGTQCDGHDFIDRAIGKGAAYIVCETPVQNTKAKIVTVEDTSIAAAEMAQTLYGEPAKHLTNLAVTGTNGKTTVAFLVRSVMRRAGLKCGLIGTIEYDTGRQCYPAGLTTPDPFDIARMQREMVDAGATHMIVEASSHSLQQNRLHGIDFKAAAFTNLGGDHLDYHQTTEDYLAAKTKLFSALSNEATAILNKESSQSQTIAKKTAAPITYYAVDQTADIVGAVRKTDHSGSVFNITYQDNMAEVQTPLIGRYNISNHLAAAGLCLACSIDLNTVAAGLSDLKAIPGRLERLEGPDFSVIIDYAHTDDALRNVVHTLRPICKGKLIVVFGCGGDRDRTKRPRMAEAVKDVANFMIITNDNPRTEDPEQIIHDIIEGLKAPQVEMIVVEPDRRKAIQMAIETATKDDIILLAGKGHEDYQIIGTQKIPFSDKAVALEYINKKKNGIHADQATGGAAGR